MAPYFGPALKDTNDKKEKADYIAGEERLSPFSGLKPADVQRNSYAELPTAIVPAYSMGGLQVDALEKRVANYAIPKEEVDALTGLLEKAAKKDEDDFKATSADEYAAAKAEAIAIYKKQHGLLKRILNRKAHKGWKGKIEVAAPKSERTELLESLVKTRDIVLEGYELFKDLPGLLAGDYNAYGELKAREKKLEDEIKLMGEAVAKAPEECGKCEKAIGILSEYPALPDDEKEKARLSVMEILGYEKLPSIDSPPARNMLIEKISAAIAQTRLNAMNYNASLELVRQELVSVVEQQKLIEEQMEELNKTWLPTLKHIDSARLRYDMTSRYARSAATVMGMNKLREKNTFANAETIAAIARVRKAQEDSRLQAEAVEEGAAEAERLLEGKAEYAAEELAVPAEPARFERKA